MNLKVALLVVSIFALTTNPSFSADNDPVQVSELVQAAIQNNPELKASQSRWQMFLEKAKQASALEDPMLMLKLENALVREPFSFGGKDPMTAKTVGISQLLPFFGKRALRQEVADREAEYYRWSAEERALELARMVKETYYGIYAADKSLQVLESNLQVLRDFVTIAQSKYTVGQGAQQDILKAGVEKSKMLETQIALKQRRKSLQATLNYLLHRPQETPVPAIADFELPKRSPEPKALTAAALRLRPQFKGLGSLVQKADASRRLALREFYPDVALSVEYMSRQPAMTDPGYDMFTVGATFNLPLQRQKRQARVAEATSEGIMAQEELQSSKNSIAGSIYDSVAQLERSQKLVELYQSGIIPQARQSLESAIISYRVNKVDFLTLFSASLDLFSYQRQLYESQAEYMIALARLEAMVGGELPLPAAESAASLPVQLSTSPSAVPPIEKQ